MKPVKTNSGAMKFADANSLHKAATLLGSKGGSVSTPAKAAAAQKNAQLPRK